MKEKWIGKISALAQNRKLAACCWALLACMGAVALYSFIAAPFTGDIKVFFAAANQVQYQPSSGLLAVLDAWELKGIANRLLMYLIYLPADWIAGFEHKVAFEFTAKAFYSLFILLLLALSAYLLPLSGKQRCVAFFVAFLSVFTVTSIIQLQAEMTGVVLCLLSAACILHRKSWSLVWSGLVGSLLFFFKSVFILLFISAILCAILFDLAAKRRIRPKNYGIPILSLIAFELVFAALLALIYPQEFRDMGYASNYQSTLLSAGSSVSLREMADRFCTEFITSAVNIPFLTLGVLAAVGTLVKMLKGRQWAAFASLVLLWILSMDIIIVSNTYFPYHYFLLMLPGIVSILLFSLEIRQCSPGILLCAGVAFAATLFCRLMLDGLEQFGIINRSTVLLVLLHLILLAVLIGAAGRNPALKKALGALTLTVSLFFWMNYASFIAPYFRNITAIERESVAINSQAFPEDFADEPVLFLDCGYAAFYADAPSYSRYFFNLPMQRWQPGDDWACQEEEYEKLMRYTGKYIVYSDWFGIDKYPELKAKLENEYTVLENGELFNDNLSWDVFNLSAIPQNARNSGTYLLVRR